jgi:hypothetical protein
MRRGQAAAAALGIMRVVSTKPFLDAANNIHQMKKAGVIPTNQLQTANGTQDILPFGLIPRGENFTGSRPRR